MPSQKPKESIYVTTTDKEILKKAIKAGIKPITEGVVAGVSAAILVKASDYDISALDVMVEVDPQITDPIYAELAITGLNKLLDTDIDLAELDKEAKAVEAKIRELMSKVKTSHELAGGSSGSGGGDTGPSMYA